MNDLRRALVNPDEDFVVIAPLVDNGKTKVISGEELKQIKEQRGVEPVAEEPKAVDEEEEYDEDEEDDEEEESGLNPKFDKAVTIMGIVMAAVILIVIIYLIGSVFGLFRFRSKDSDSQNTQTQTETQTESETQTEQLVAVENVTGRTKEEAQSALEAQGFFMFVIAEQKSDKPAGTVIEQDPAGGTQIAAGSTVNVIVAGDENKSYTDDNTTNGDLKAVPSVLGNLEKDAFNALTAAGFKVEKSYEYSDSVDAGKVISQSPNGGTAASGSKVTIVISQGQKSVDVPNVLGQAEEKAQNTLASAGLKVAIEEAHSDAVEVGKVIKQSIAGGKTVPAGTTVTITVSLGAEKSSYSFSKSYSADGAIGASYTLTGSDGKTYDSGEVDGPSVSVSASDMPCESGTVTITWDIETTDEDGVSNVTTKTETHNVTFSKQ